METFIGWSEQDEESEFKSYYVVWKLSPSESRPNILSRLNRTM